MASVGSLSVDLLLQSASFMSGMKQAAAQTAETAASIKEQMDGIKEAVVGLGEVLAIDYFTEAVNKALEYAETIKKVSEQTGLTTTSIQAFNYAASQQGVSTEDSNNALEKFTKNLGAAMSGNQKMATLFKDLGVTSSDANVALGQFADGLSKVPTKAQQAYDVTTAFGKGAQGLTELLSDGKKGLDDYATAAEQLGVILDGKVIDGAVDAEHKISALKMVLNAEWSNAIDQNAGSIANLATQFINLAGAAGQYIEKMQNGGSLFNLEHPDLVKAAAYLTGGDANATENGSYTQLMGNAAGRATLLDRNTQQIQDLDSGATGQNMYSAADRAKQRNALLLQRKGILAADAPQPAPATPPAPLLPGPKPPKGRKDHSADQQTAFDKQLGSEDLDTYSLEAQLTTDPRFKANYQRDAIRYDYGYQDPDTGQQVEGQKDKEIDDQLAAGKFGDKSSDLAKSRADELKTQNDINGQMKLELVNRQLDATLAAQDLALKTSDLTNQEDVLKGAQSLARTSVERASIGDQLIDLDTQMQAAQLDAVLASKDSTDVEKQIAAARKALLPQLNAQAKQKNEQDNAGPMAAYLNAMPKTVGEIDESLQTAAVQGLGSLTTGIEAAINGTGSLKSAFSSLATSIITDLEKIVIEEEIVKPLANLLTGGSGGGGGILGSLASGLGGLFGGGFASTASSLSDDLTASLTAANAAGNASILAGFRANGGLTQPGTYMVGERGPEMLSIGSNASVMSTSQLSRMGNSGGGGVSITSTVNGVNDPAMVRRTSAQTLASAVPAILRMSSDNTAARSRQPRMR